MYDVEDKKMLCPEDGRSSSGGYDDEYWTEHFPSRAEMEDVTKDFGILPEDSKYKIFKGKLTGSHSDWDDVEKHMYEREFSEDYFAVYYDDKKVDDLVPANELALGDLPNQKREIMPEFAKFDVDTVIVNDSLTNNRKEDLRLSSYHSDCVAATNKINEVHEDVADKTTQNYLSDLRSMIFDRGEDQGFKYASKKHAEDIILLAAHTRSVPESFKDETFYKNISVATKDKMFHEELSESHGLKKFKESVGRAYSFVKTLSFSYVEKKLRHKDKELTEEMVKETYKDALKLMRAGQPVPAKALQDALVSSPEVEAFLKEHPSCKISTLFKEAEKEASVERPGKGR